MVMHGPRTVSVSVWVAVGFNQNCWQDRVQCFCLRHHADLGPEYVVEKL